MWMGCIDMGVSVEEKAFASWLRSAGLEYRAYASKYFGDVE